MLLDEFSGTLANFISGTCYAVVAASDDDQFSFHAGQFEFLMQVRCVF